MSLAPLVMLVALAAGQRVVTVQEVPVGVWFVPAVAADAESLRSDLAAIRRAGFDSITTPVIWKEVEPRRGSFGFLAIERLIAAAGATGLKVRVKVMTDTPPAWAASTDAVLAFMDYTRKRMVLHQEVVSVEASRSADRPANERIAVAPAASAAAFADARLRMWTAIARGARGISFDDGMNGKSEGMRAIGELAGVVTRNQALFGPLRHSEARSTVAVEGDQGIEVHILESSEALVILALNQNHAAVKASITFAPEIPEAIWQNLEEGTSVSFVMGKDGPVMTHAFAPRDALVLTIRRRPR
jgi:hypothetical protein